MVVKRKIAHRQQIGTGGFLGGPVRTADIGRYLLQFGFGFRAFPKGFNGKFQLALRADARIAGEVECVHKNSFNGLQNGKCLGNK